MLLEAIPRTFRAIMAGIQELQNVLKLSLFLSQVDIKCTSCSNGGYYYSEHLAVLGKPSSCVVT